jgi:hypothetical protein
MNVSKMTFQKYYCVYWMNNVRRKYSREKFAHKFIPTCMSQGVFVAVHNYYMKMTILR